MTWYYKPKQCIVHTKMPQNDHRCLLFDLQKQGNLYNDPFKPTSNSSTIPTTTDLAVSVHRIHLPTGQPLNTPTCCNLRALPGVLAATDPGRVFPQLKSYCTHIFRAHAFFSGFSRHASQRASSSTLEGHRGKSCRVSRRTVWATGHRGKNLASSHFFVSNLLSSAILRIRAFCLATAVLPLGLSKIVLLSVVTSDTCYFVASASCLRRCVEGFPKPIGTVKSSDFQFFLSKLLPSL